PALMARASRKRFPQAAYRAPGGRLMIGFIILFGLINAVTHIAALLGWLPVYR
ncbi:TPA: aromatic amino acid transport family protein, partial [Yersinia enterocolitica]